MSEADDLAISVVELLKEVGEPIILDRTQNAEYNAATSEVEGAPKKWNGIAAPDEYSLRDIDGDQVRQGDVKLIVGSNTPGASFTRPAIADRIRYDSAWWRVIDCQPIRYQGRDVAYTVQLRK